MDSKAHFVSASPTTTTTMTLFQRAQTGPPSLENSTAAGNGNFKTGGDLIYPRLDEFEFETNKVFSGHLDFDEEREKFRDCGGLPPTMAFADELFVNGRVMPLKLPPRLQGDIEYNRLHVSQTKSPRTKIPFARKGSWAGDFDPFMTALEKVREENRGRNSHHKRSRSHSPFRAMPKFTDMDTSGHFNQDIIREETSTKSARSFLFGKRAGSMKIEHGPDKPVESKVQKLKGFLFKYASFGKDNKQTKETSEEVRKPGYFSWLSFRFKGNGQKRMPADTHMTVVEYNPAFTISDG